MSERAVAIREPTLWDHVSGGDDLRLIRHPGFFEIQRGSRAVGLNESVDAWRVGVCVRPESARVDWFSGDTYEEARDKALSAIDDAPTTESEPS